MSNYIFFINAFNKNLGHLCTSIIKILLGKNTSFYSEGVNKGNYIVIYNIAKIQILKKKVIKKIFYKNSQRPGSLKKENFISKFNKNPSFILENAIKKMLPKNSLQKSFFNKLYLYNTDNIQILKNKNFNKFDLYNI